MARLILCVSAAVIISSCSALDTSSQSEESSSTPSQLSRQGRYLLNGPQSLNNYKLITKSDGTTALFYNAKPQAYVNYTDTQTETVSALGNAALFLGSLFLLGQLPARMLGIDGSARNDNQEDVDYALDNDDYYNEDSNLGHRQGLLAPKAKPKPLFKMPKLKFVNPFRKFRRNLKQKFRKRFMKRRRHRRPARGFGGMRRLKKKSGKVGPIREFTYRKPMSPYMEAPHPSRYATPSSSHRNLPLTPLSAVVGNTLTNRYNQQHSRLQSNEVLDYNNGPPEVLDPPMKAPSPLGLDYTNNYPNDPPPRGMTYDYPSSITFGGNRGVQQYNDYGDYPVRGQPVVHPSYSDYDDYGGYGFGGMGASSGDNGGFSRGKLNGGDKEKFVGGDGGHVESFDGYKSKFPIALGSTGTTSTTSAPFSSPFDPTLTPPSIPSAASTYFNPGLNPKPESDKKSSENEVSTSPFSTSTFRPGLLSSQASTPTPKPSRDTNKKYALNNSIRVRRRKPASLRRKPKPSNEPEDFTVDPIGALDRIKEESKSKRFGTSTPFSSSKPVGDRRQEVEREEPITRLSGFDFGSSSFRGGSSSANNRIVGSSERSEASDEGEGGSTGFVSPNGFGFGSVSGFGSGGTSSGFGFGGNTERRKVSSSSRSKSRHRQTTTPSGGSSGVYRKNRRFGLSSERNQPESERSFDGLKESSKFERPSMPKFDGFGGGSDGFDPFKDMEDGFGGKNDDWMSSISEAFDGFSDFKKIDGDRTFKEKMESR